MKYFWERPLSSLQYYPLIYSVFDGIDDDNGKISFRIEDLNEDHFEEAIELMKNSYLMNDPMMSSKNILQDEISTIEVVENWRAILKQRISIVCFKEDSNQIIGLNFLSVLNEEEFDWKFKGETLSEIKSISRFIKNIFFNPYEHYSVDKIITGVGHYVEKNHMKYNIEKEMIKVRRDIAKMFDIRISSELFSTSVSQNAAAELGYDVNFSIDYKKLPKLICQGYFPGVNEEKFKIMSKKFN